jgi:hypothetical protein
MPKAGTVKLDATPRPQVAMATGNIAWCRIKTDDQGTITEDPTIVVSGANHDGTHYYPEDPDASGQDGDYYVKLFKLEDDAGTPRVRVYQQSDIEHWAQLWTGRNVGTGSRVFKEHTEEENIYKFRTLVGLAPLTVEEDGDNINVSFGAGADLDLEVYDEGVDEAGHFQFGEPTLLSTLCWRAGLFVGQFVMGAVLPDPTVPAVPPINVRVVSTIT